MTTAVAATAFPPAPPTDEPQVAAAAAPGTVCPETGQSCTEHPECVLGGSGKCMCAKWVARIRREAQEKV